MHLCILLLHWLTSVIIITLVTTRICATEDSEMHGSILIGFISKVF